MTPYTLHAVSGTILSQPEALASGETTIGRSRSCDVRVGEVDVSGKHCVLKITEEAVAVENISQNGTLLDGQPLEFITLMQPGQILSLGSRTKLQLNRLPPPPPKAEAEEDEPTRQSPPENFEEDLKNEPTTQPAPDISVDEDETTKKNLLTQSIIHQEDAITEKNLPRTHPHNKRDRDDDATARISPSPGSNNQFADNDLIEQTRSSYDQTRAMETRVLRPEDIEALRESERAKPRKRFTLFVITGIVLLAIAFFLWPESKPPETEFQWPLDENGEFLNTEVDGISGGLASGRYMIGLPWSQGWTQTQPDPETLIVTTFLSRDFNVPMILHLTETASPRLLSQNLQHAAREWIEEMRAKSTGWQFDAPSDPLFLGSENGIPFLTISYAHQEEGSWYGIARIFLYHNRRVVLRSEVPYNERIRASRLINLRYIIVSRDYERRYWAGATEEPQITSDDLLRRIRPELQRNAPVVWAGLEQLIFQACRRASLDGDERSLREAEGLLLSLRERQRRWFNAQRIARVEAERTEQDDRVRQITELCKGVFSHEGDLRHFIVRRVRW